MDDQPIHTSDARHDIACLLKSLEDCSNALAQTLPSGHLGGIFHPYRILVDDARKAIARIKRQTA